MEKRHDGNKYVVTNLFPVSRDVAEKSVASFIGETSELNGIEVTREANVFIDQNPEAFDQLYRRVSGFSSDVWKGVLIGHRALRLSAEEQGGRLPFFYRGFVDALVVQRHLNITMLADAFNLSFVEAKELIEESRVWSMQKNEAVLDTEFRKRMSEVFNQERLISMGNGLVSIYYLIKDGLKDPRNYS